MSPIVSGYLSSGHAFDRLGSGPRQLVILQGLTIDTEPMRRWAGVMLGPYRQLADEFTVTLVNRRPGLVPGVTMHDIAADVAALIRSDFGGSADLVGASTGGSIALQVAIDHPDVARRLVVHSAAYTLGPAGRRVQRQAMELARRGDWHGVGRLMMAWVRPVHRPGRVIFPLVVPLGALVLAHKHPRDASEFVAVVEAEDAFDCRADLGRIVAPTLVIAGALDPGYTPELFRETAAGIPGARLVLYDGMGHPASGPRFRDDLAAFLREDGRGSEP